MFLPGFQNIAEYQLKSKLLFNVFIDLTEYSIKLMPMFSPESVVLMYCLMPSYCWKNSTQASSPLDPNEQTAGSIHLWSVPISAY